MEIVLTGHQYYLSFFLGHFIQAFVKISNSGQADTAFSFSVDESLYIDLLELLYGGFGGWRRAVVVGVVFHYALYDVFQALLWTFSKS